MNAPFRMKPYVRAAGRDRDGWVAAFEVEASLAEKHVLYQNIRVVMREVDSDGALISNLAYSGWSAQSPISVGGASLWSSGS